MSSWQKKVVHVLASGLYAGHSPKAPGTIGTLVALPLVYMFNWTGNLGYLLLTMVMLCLGILVSQLYQDQMGSQHDRQEIVIDEIVGLLITMALVPITWQTMVLGFLLFRILDIWKPGPIGLLDQKVKGGIGVMLDDVAAGIIANIILQLLISRTSLLGVTVSDGF